MEDLAVRDAKKNTPGSIQVLIHHVKNTLIIVRYDISPWSLSNVNCDWFIATQRTGNAVGRVDKNIISLSARIDIICGQLRSPINNSIEPLLPHKTLSSARKIHRETFSLNSIDFYPSR